MQMEKKMMDLSFFFLLKFLLEYGMELLSFNACVAKICKSLLQP
jgi:hypothetical protein